MAIEKILCDYSAATKRNEKQATTLARLFRHWKDFFYNKILNIFIWDGLPFPQRELESAAIINGINFAAYHNRKIGIVTRNGTVYGVTRYPDVYTSVLYSMPRENGGTISGEREIGKDAIILYNTSNQMSLIPFIERYASLMTHTDLTIKNALIDLRCQDVFVSGDSGMTETFKQFFNRKYNGEPSAIIDKSMLIEEGAINLAKNNYFTDIRALVDVEHEILRQFYRDIGVRWIKDKRAELNSNEVDGDTQLLLFNIRDMYNNRLDFQNNWNAVFKDRAEPIKVRLNNDFILEGENDNVSTANNN